MWEGRRCCLVHHGLGGCSMDGDFCSTQDNLQVCGAGAGQGILPYPQLCRCPRTSPWDRAGSKAMDHTGERVLQPAWARGVWLLEAGESGVLVGHVRGHLSARQGKRRGCGIPDQKPPLHHTEVSPLTGMLPVPHCYSCQD